MPPKGRIFLSYRRDDSRYATRSIYDRLVAHFGEDGVFMDVDTIQAGLDFVEVLQREVQSCDVLVAVVGKAWLNIKDPAGNRRLDSPEDFVRVEVATALNRNIRVIPVLLDGVLMPRSTELPDELKPFARRNALRVEHDSFGSDVYRLVKQLELALQETEDSKFQKASELKAEHERALQQNGIAKLYTQADTAIAVQDWDFAKKKLQEILALDADDLTAQAKLEVVEVKLVAIREQQIAEEKELEATRLVREREEKRKEAQAEGEHQQEPVENFRQKFIAKNGKVFFLSVAVIALLYFLSSIINNIETPAASTPYSTMIAEKDGMTLVYVPAGEFQMGSDDGDDDEKPVHTVHLDAYWIDRTEVSNIQFGVFVEKTSYETDAEKIGGSFVFRDDSWDFIEGANWKHIQGPNSDTLELNDHPVVHVSWNDAWAYCEWVGRRLPSEAEWEKAARGELDGKLYPWGNKSPVCAFGAENGAKFDDEKSCNDTGTEPVGSYSPNGYGAYDMAGNVWEWVNDWYASDYYANSPADNPLGPEIGEARVVRSGSWVVGKNFLRSALRIERNPAESGNLTGFRCARSP